MTMAAATPTPSALMRMLSGLSALRGRLRAAAEARRSDRAVARLATLSPHFLNDIGLGDSFGVAEADFLPPPPALRP